MSRFGPNSDTLLDVTLNHPGAVARCELTKNQRCSVWHVPANTTARYLRVIHNGVNFMHFAQVIMPIDLLSAGAWTVQSIRSALLQLYP